MNTHASVNRFCQWRHKNKCAWNKDGKEIGTYSRWDQEPKPLFWIFLLLERGLNWLPRFTKVLPIVTLILSLDIHPMLKEELFGAYVVEPLWYIENDVTHSLE